MAGELNTELHDDPAACRATADWLGTVGPGVSRVGDALHQQRSASESFWQGLAGDSCRASLSSQGRDSDQLHQVINQVKKALDEFAGTITTVRNRLDQARTVAHEGNLNVTPTAILPPGPGPDPAPLTPPGGGPVLPQVQQQHDAATADHAKRTRAFEEASSTVDAARTMQQDAHDKLDKAMKDPLETVKATKTYAMLSVGAGLGYIKGSHTAAASYLDRARKLELAANTMDGRAANKGLASLAETTHSVAERGRSMAAQARNDGAKRLGKASAVPEKARRIISANPSGLVKSGSMVGKIGRGALRGLPYVGTAATLTSAASDVAMGKDAGDAAVDTGANLAGGIAGGETGALVGSAFGPVGTVVGGVVGGIAGSLGATQATRAIRGE